MCFMCCFSLCQPSSQGSVHIKCINMYCLLYASPAFKAVCILNAFMQTQEWHIECIICVLFHSIPAFQSDQCSTCLTSGPPQAPSCPGSHPIQGGYGKGQKSHGPTSQYSGPSRSLQPAQHCQHCSSTTARSWPHCHGIHSCTRSVSIAVHYYRPVFTPVPPP